MKTETEVERTNEDNDNSTVPSGEFFPKMCVYKDDQQIGIHSLEQIQSLLREGVIEPGDLVWVDGGGAYIPIENVSAFLEDALGAR